MGEPLRDATERFSDRVDDYDRYRPGYPTGVLDVLREQIGLRPSWTIADLGSGTGISAEMFLRNGNDVLGIEPNRPMREAAERRLKRYSSFTSVAGSAEATTLTNRSIDMVLAAQAFHWFDVLKARKESQRILKPGGAAVVIWNTRRVDASPFLRDYELLLIDHATDYQLVRHDRLDQDTLALFFGGPYASHTIPYQQRLDAASLRGRLQSSSYVPAVGAAGHQEFIEAVARLYQRHQQDGAVTIEYDTELHFGVLA